MFPKLALILALATGAAATPLPQPPPRTMQRTLIVEIPNGWKQEPPITGAKLLLSKDSDDAVIMMQEPVFPYGSPAEECQALIKKLSEDPRERFTPVKTLDPRTATFDFWSDDASMGQRTATAVIRHLGKNKEASVTFMGNWPPSNQAKSKATLLSFARHVALVSQ